MTDELLEMQRDTFKGLLLVTWFASLAALWVTLAINIYPGPKLVDLALWIGIGPLNFGVHLLARRHFRLATWVWVCAIVLFLPLLIPWASTPDLGSLPYAFVLVVVVSGLLISRSAPLYIAGLASVLSLAALGVSGHLNSAGTGAIFPPLVMTWTVAVFGWVSSDQLVTALTWTRNAQLEASARAEELRRSRDELRKSLLVQDNLNALLQEAHWQATRWAAQLETAAEVSRRITSLLDLEELLIEVANLICDKFGYYYTGVFLLEEVPEAGNQMLVLRAAGGERGRALLEQGLRLAADGSSINGCAASTGEVQCFNDVTMSPYFRRIELLRETISELAIPLYLGQRIVGTLDMQSKRVNAFSQDDVEALEGLAAQVAIAIQNTRLYESEQARRQVAETLREVGRILSGTLDLEEVLDHLLEQLALVVPYSRTAVLLRSEDVLHIAAARGYGDTQRIMELSVDIRENDVFSQVSHSRQVLVVSDVEQSPGWQQQDWLPLDHSWLGAPLIVQGRVIGMLSLTRRERGAFGPGEGGIVFTFASQAAIAIHNASLYDQVRRFNQELERMVAERTAELQRAYEQLEQLDRNKSDFINIAAHELRTPLTVIKGYAEMMRLNPAILSDPLLAETLEGVLNGMKRLHEIVNSMLDVARIDSQVLDLHPKLMEIAPLIEKIEVESGPVLKERQLTLQVEDLSALSRIKADPDMLYKVFYNVVINAIKFTPDGGRITIAGQSIGDESLGKCVEMRVSDTGIGIDPEHHELIFEKLYQTGRVALHSSGKTAFKGGGPGLGLAIVRGIVQAHGGRVWVESEGHDEETCPGSCFHILLPVSGLEERAEVLP